MREPSLVQRLEALVHCLNEARDSLDGVKSGEIGFDAMHEIDNALVITGGVLKAVDGR